MKIKSKISRILLSLVVLAGMSGFAFADGTVTGMGTINPTTCVATPGPTSVDFGTITFGSTEFSNPTSVTVENTGVTGSDGGSTVGPLIIMGANWQYGGGDTGTYFGYPTVGWTSWSNGGSYTSLTGSPVAVTAGPTTIFAKPKCVVQPDCSTNLERLQRTHDFGLAFDSTDDDFRH